MVIGRGGASVFSRMAKNIGWVAGSRGFSSVLSVVYLAVAARALGPVSFGVFALILTYAQLIANLVQFQSWKGVIRYGAIHAVGKHRDRLGRLFGFTATLDFGSALAGAIIAVVGVSLVGPLMHWTHQEESYAAVFAAILLLTTGATPTGMLRLFDRFDLVAYCEAVGPLLRLAGSVVAWVLAPNVATFLAIWAFANVTQAAVQWLAAIRIDCCKLQFGRTALRGALRENERIWPFMLQTNVSNSVSMFWTQLGTLAVGAVAGPVQAGGFRLASRIARGMLRPLQPVVLAIYPELSRLVAEQDDRRLRTLISRVILVAIALALVVVFVTLIGSRDILRLLAGEEFEFANTFLIMLAIASAIDLAGFAFEPLQNAHGRSWNVLRSKLVAAGIYVALLSILLPLLGGKGAAIATIACSLAVFVQLALCTAQTLRSPRPELERPNQRRPGDLPAATPPAE